MDTQKMKFINVRVTEEHLNHFEDLRHERSRLEGKRVSLREIFADALEAYLNTRPAQH